MSLALERAIVLELKEDQALIRTQRKSACQSCQLESSCGQGLMTKLGSERSMEFWLKNTLSANAGQSVSVYLPDEGLLAASVLMFIVPLLSMLGVAGLVFWQTSNELITIAGGLLGLFLGFGFARFKSNTMQEDPRFQPSLKSIQLMDTAGASCHPVTDA